MIKPAILIGLFGLLVGQLQLFEELVSTSVIYPHLAMFYDEGECGTGAVVLWVDRLWVINYGSRLPFGSSDKHSKSRPNLIAPASQAVKYVMAVSGAGTMG